jgi:hypothetical protein
MLRIVKGDPTPEEVAALVAVLASIGTADGAPAPRQVSAWADPHRGVRTIHRPGPGAWRASGLPR